jgi:hypothetical protein
VLSKVNNPGWLHSFKANTVNASLYCVSTWAAKGMLAQPGMWLKRSWSAPAPESTDLHANDV